MLVVPRVFRAPSGPAAVCAGGRRPAREPSAPRASLGASSRSPARPRHRPPAPRQVPPAPSTPVGPGVLTCGLVRRIEARPGPAPRRVPYPQFRMQFPDTCSSSLSEKPGISTITFQSMKCARGNCMRICADRAPPPPTGTAACPFYSLWASWGSRVLGFWGALMRVVTNVVNWRCFSCRFRPVVTNVVNPRAFSLKMVVFWPRLTTFVTLAAHWSPGRVLPPPMGTAVWPCRPAGPVV